ncbi:hypothetical protein VCV18_001921 [Metarhizium anisopliae]
MHQDSSHLSVTLPATPSNARGVSSLPAVEAAISIAPFYPLTTRRHFDLAFEVQWNKGAISHGGTRDQVVVANSAFRCVRIATSRGDLTNNGSIRVASPRLLVICPTEPPLKMLSIHGRRRCSEGDDWFNATALQTAAKTGEYHRAFGRSNVQLSIQRLHWSVVSDDPVG